MSDPADAFILMVDEMAAGQRIDAYLRREIPEMSRAYIASLIHEGRICVGRMPIKPSYRLRPGDEITGEIPPPRPVECLPEPIPLDVLYQDPHLLVLNKPAGMVVHPAPGHPSGTLVNALLHHCPDLGGISGEIRPGIVHRLDKDTTGLMVVAKSGETQASLAAQFRLRRIQKWYLALVHGHMEGDQGSIIMPIGRHPVDRLRMSTVTKSGKIAVTRWLLKESFHHSSLVEVDLLTGRTHQIRVHFSAIRHPVIGDPLYGPKHPLFGTGELRRCLQAVHRQMLHAWQIRFAHPVTGLEMRFTAPLPSDMEHLLQFLRTNSSGE